MRSGSRATTSGRRVSELWARMLSYAPLGRGEGAGPLGPPTGPAARTRKKLLGILPRSRPRLGTVSTAVIWTVGTGDSIRVGDSSVRGRIRTAGPGPIDKGTTGS